MRAGFVFSETFIGIRRNLTMTIAMIITTAISLGLLGFAVGAVRLADQTSAIYGDKVQVTINLTRPLSQSDPNCGSAQCQAILMSLEHNALVDTYDYQSQAQAFTLYKQEFAGQPSMVEIARQAAFNASFQIKLKDPQRFGAIEDQYGKSPGVDSVNTQSELVNKLLGLLNTVRDTALVIALIQAFAAVLLISNMVQVAARSRRVETNIMRLVGASRWRTQLPFMLEALIAAVVGIGLSIAGLVVIKATLVDKVIGPVISAGIFAPIDGTYLFWAAVVIVPVGLVLAAASAYTTLRLYVRL